MLVANSLGLAAEEQPIHAHHFDRTSTGPVAVLRNGLEFLYRFDPFAGLRLNPLELPLQPRVSHSARTLRVCELATGDRFVGELLGWNDDSAKFRLLTGQQIQIPINAILRISNPPGEIGLIEDSFESNSDIRKKTPSLIDDTQAADGTASLRIIAPYRIDFDEPLESARIEFLFHAPGPSMHGGGWQLDTEKGSSKESPITIHIRNGIVSCPDDLARRGDSATQPLPLTAGWHSFIALVSPERTRLIVDQSTLASFSTNERSIKSISFSPATNTIESPLLVDALQVRRIIEFDDTSPRLIDQDAIELSTGDIWLGKLQGLSQNGAILQDRRGTNIVPWTKIISVSRLQSQKPLRQMAPVASGFLATIDLQPFVDRPNCSPEHWTVTVIQADSEHLTAVHSLIGELKFAWSDISRIQTEFFGQSLLLDGRRIHLGNSIRTDFEQVFPHGPLLQSAFRLSEIPNGQPFISMTVSEMEAASSSAPPGSPFLAELRAGKLITELIINGQRVGELNSLIRFKAKRPNSERIRISFSRDLLRTGKNTVELTQKPLSDSQREFDDCEIRQLRLEFDLSHAFE